MPLTFHGPEPSIRTFWQSPNGNWSIQRVAFDGRRWLQLLERWPRTSRHGARSYNTRHSSIIRRDENGAWGCDHPRPIPAYVKRAMIRHLPG